MLDRLGVEEYENILHSDQMAIHEFYHSFLEDKGIQSSRPARVIVLTMA